MVVVSSVVVEGDLSDVLNRVRSASTEFTGEGRLFFVSAESAGLGMQVEVF